MSEKAKVKKQNDKRETKNIKLIKKIERILSFQHAFNRNLENNENNNKN
jgi:hypothetical protein